MQLASVSKLLTCSAFGKAASLVGPRHLFSDHSTPPTYHSSDRVAKIGPDSEQVQVLALFAVGDVYVSLCKKSAYAPFSARRRS